MTPGDPAPPRRPGGRTARIAADVLSSTMGRLLSGGYERLTVADVAADAGVAESTVYRRWRSKPELVADAMLRFSEQEIPAPDTGSLAGDLAAWLREITAAVTQPPVTRLLRAIAGLDDAVPYAAVARVRFFAGRYARFEESVRRAQRRGELGADVDATELAEMLTGPLYLRVLFTGGPVDEGFVDRSVDRVLRAFARPDP